MGPNLETRDSGLRFRYILEKLPAAVQRGIPIKFTFNHGASFAFYFDDLDGNMVEVYWPTGDLRLKQPQVFPLDLSQPDEVLLRQLAKMV